MYEAEEAVQDILSQVKRLLAEPAQPGSIFITKMQRFRIRNVLAWICESVGITDPDPTLFPQWLLRCIQKSSSYQNNFASH